MVESSRIRIRYLAFAVTTILVGLVVHWDTATINAVTRDVLGDALWAAMIVWLVSAAVPTARVGARAAIAMAICAAVELSQLYHTPALDTVRTTTVGHLVLGSGFDPRDLVAYAGGVCVAVLLDRFWLGKTTRS